MDKRWLISVFLISFSLLAILERQRINSLAPYFQAERSLKLERFQSAKKNLSPKDQELLKLWESMLTGRSAPVAKWMKEHYRLLGLNHLFTPSGFHLSAVLWPFMKFIQNRTWQFILLCLIGSALFFIPGQAALKRMVVVKAHQKILGMHVGFIFAIIIDILFGSFQNSTLSFSYSFLFLGIIYSGAEGVGLIFWFFIAQLLLAHFQNTELSLLLLLLSPLMNLGFGMAMPLLFALAFPLWAWQLHAGLFILRFLQVMVDFSAIIIQHCPRLEINAAIILMVILFSLQRWKWLALTTILFSGGLNLDLSKTPTANNYEFSPIGLPTKVVNDTVYFNDGKCRMELIRGFWWKKCSPKKRSTRKRLKKFSYLLLEQEKSSLHG